MWISRNPQRLAKRTHRHTGSRPRGAATARQTGRTHRSAPTRFVDISDIGAAIDVTRHLALAGIARRGFGARHAVPLRRLWRGALAPRPRHTTDSGYRLKPRLQYVASKKRAIGDTRTDYQMAAPRGHEVANQSVNPVETRNLASLHRCTSARLTLCGGSRRAEFPALPNGAR